MRNSTSEPLDIAMSDHFDLYYHDCSRQGIRYAAAMLRNKSDAEEAVQEAFYRMYKVDPFQQADGYRGRFFSTLRNHCIDLIRRRKVQKEITVGSAIENVKVGQAADSAEMMSAIDAAIGTLPENYRQALLLKTHGQLSYDEIATVTGATHDQVRTWIYRARRRLELTLQAKGMLDCYETKSKK